MKTAKAKPKRTAVQMGILFTAIFFIGIGIAKQEYLEVMQKAVRICLECIGIG
ncbi:MAG: hypothetical protein HFJ08_03985 [Lachnospiraceae bacterium]|jgi:hypothetical protein|nr:hypothetical protein [Lachnospiraceae bacterium]MCI9399624.1 hypothetical protein [Lachnospiraceae bacterium]MCX4376978.1 CD1871A family CXXC motif-containing protein [Lachnospiraceae bacterium]